MVSFEIIAGKSQEVEDQSVRSEIWLAITNRVWMSGNQSQDPILWDNFTAAENITYMGILMILAISKL